MAELDIPPEPCEIAGMAVGSIVVGTDLSESASEAIRQAASWAAREQKRLVAVHVVPERVFPGIDVSEVSSRLREHVAKLCPAGVTFDVMLEAGSAHARLMSVADATRSELLVVGASGAGSVERFLFGSTAQQVVRYAHCTVLVTRASPTAGPVLAATDFSDAAAPAVKRAAEQAVKRGVGLVLLHSIYEPPPVLDPLGPIIMAPPAQTSAEHDARRYAADETLRTLLDANQMKGQSVVTDDSPVRAVAQQAQSLGASLVVVGTHGRSGLARVALGSVAERVVQSSPCSVLVVRMARPS